MGKIVLSGVRLVGGPPGSNEGPQDIIISEGRIEAVRPAGAPVPAGARRIDGAGLTAAPGFIDLHVHGGAGADFMDATAEAFTTIGRFHAAGGTTAYLPTTTTEAMDSILAGIDMAEHCRRNRLGIVEILGVHVEGPYLALRRHGCHDPSFVRRPSPEENRRYLERAGVIRRVTLAPEIPGAREFIRELRAAGILPSGGHSNATADEVFHSVDFGMAMITHLYCAMSTVSKDGPYRIAGMLEAALLDDRLAVELIADLKHLPRELLLLALKVKGLDRVCFVTDAMRGAGMPDGTYPFGSRRGPPAVVEGGVSRNLENTGLASSTVRMIDLVRHGVEALGLDLVAAVRLASLNPARFMGLDGRKGSIEAGKDADVVLLQEDPDLRVRMTLVGGDLVWDSRGKESS